MPLSPTDQTAIDTIVTDALTATNTNGLALAITGPVGDVTKAYGTKSQTGNPKPALATTDNFRIGSATKMYVATAILAEIDKGNLSLSDTLSQFVPNITNNSTITIEQLLRHTSGVFDYTREPITQVNGFGYAAISGCVGRWDDDKTLTAIRRNTPAFTPGTSWEYSNSNYVLLGIILGLVTSKTTRQALEDAIFTPLGLSSTEYPADGADIKPPLGMPTPFSKGYAPSYLSWVKADRTDFNANYAGGSGAIVSNVIDLSVFMAAQRDGTLLDPATQAMRESVFTTGLPFTGVGPATFDYGLGISRYGEWLGHNGATLGYQSAAFYHPSTGATIAAVSNYYVGGVQLTPEKVFVRTARALYPGTV